jgi:hypothetical protein
VGNQTRTCSQEQLEDDVWLASLNKASDAGALTSASFQSALTIAVVITLGVFEHHILCSVCYDSSWLWFVFVRIQVVFEPKED